MESEDLTDTARIPIVVPNERSYEKVYKNEQARIEEENNKQKEKEAIYVSNSETSDASLEKKKEKKIWPLFLIAILLLAAVYFLKIDHHLMGL